MTMKMAISRAMACAGGLLLPFGAHAKVVVNLNAEYAEMARYAVDPLKAVLFESPKSLDHCPAASVDATSIDVLENSENVLLKFGADRFNSRTKLIITKPWHVGGDYVVDDQVCHITVVVKSYNADGSFASQKTCHVYAKRTGNQAPGRPFMAKCQPP